VPRDRWPPVTADIARRYYPSITTDYFSGEPVAYNGVVYVQGAGPVFALSELTGKVLWQSSYLDGDGSSVSANASGVYVAAGCSWFRLSLTTGAMIWSGNSGCTGGGGTTYLSIGRDFETVRGFVVSQATGKTLGTFSGVPAFSGANGYFANGSSVFCENVKTLTPVFTAPVPSTIVTSPVIAGETLYVGDGESRGLRAEHHDRQGRLARRAAGRARRRSAVQQPDLGHRRRQRLAGRTHRDAGHRVRVRLARSAGEAIDDGLLDWRRWRAGDAGNRQHAVVVVPVLGHGLSGAAR